MAINDTKKNVLLGQSVEEQVKNIDDNFTSLFDTVDDLNDGINNSGFITKDVDNLTNYTVKTETGTDIELSLNTNNYTMTLNLKNAAGTVVSTDTIDFPIESMVVNATYASGTLTLTLQNGNTLDVDISAIISGLVPDTRTVNGKQLNANVTLTQDDVSDGTTYKRFSQTEKTKLAAIDDSLKNVTADQIGKVKDVKVNGTSVLGTDGVAAITIADLEADFVSVATTDSVWKTNGIMVNGTTYQAIRVEKTDSALGVFNSAGQEIIVQKVVAKENNVDYLYLCVGTTKIACTIRKLSGGAVGTGGGVKYMHHLCISGHDTELGNFEIYSMHINDSDTPITTYAQLASAVAIRRMMATGHCTATNSPNPIYCLQKSPLDDNIIGINFITNTEDRLRTLGPDAIQNGGIVDSVLKI